MNCPTCSTPLSATAKFCDQCGTRRPEPMADDWEVALRLRDLLLGNLHRMGVRIAEPVLVQDEASARVMWMATLTKARELLCGPKDAEIVRLKAELENAQHQLKYHAAEWGTLFELVPTDCPNDSHPEHVNKIVHEIKRMRTAAANARREAFEVALAILREAGPDDMLGDLIERLEDAKRDACHPAAETPTPCLKCGSSDLDDRGNCYTCLARKSTQPPARDVDGMARVLEPWFEDCKDPKGVAKCCAEEVFAHLDGGPRT